jgi:hypothetical protein
LCVVLLLGSGCSPAKDPAVGVLALDVEALTDAHTRVVWVQDTHALTDVFARGDALRLMGYDSRDGIGERVLLAGPDNFSKPMFVADGSRIIYSNVSDGYVYGVDWGGESPFRLVQGHALAVWRDAGKVDWVYVGTEPADSRAPAYHRVTRHQIGRPAVSEPVWQGQPVGEDSFQLSADGRLAGGNFPWPECGILHLAEQRIEHLGRGCWTSLAPDNSYRFWIFDGSHRNLLLFDTVAESRQTVLLSTAPGIDGHEVYHPRWSNHPRFMAMTGPYKIRSGGNNIRGGGAAVEIFLGRFRADFGAIEQWVQLTDNPYANFFPDLWVAPGTMLEDAVRAQKIRTLTGAHTRVVWLQDMGDGTDYLARGRNLQLMGFDTDDGRGERVILAAGRNMAKPMFAVDGERVLFSDRDAGSMHMVDWDGAAVHDLGKGFVLHTWRDPATGIEWLYYAHSVVDDGKTLPTHAAIYRKALPPFHGGFSAWALRIRGRTRARQVWGQTYVSEDSYQLSADGRFASAPFPWPEVGVHDVEAMRWFRHGRGCWVAMSPDNSYLFWILDGPHRNLIMQRVNQAEPDRWSVNISSLPGTDRYEVYHPRWSNHPHVLAVTGPYKVGEGAYRLSGGGEDVEVWLGRFTEDHRDIAEWVQVSEDAFANFYPDVWVAPVAGGTVSSTKVASVARAERSDVWPSSRDGLAYLWEHGGAQNEIVKTEGSRVIFRPEARGLARYGDHHAMWVDKGFFVDTAVPSFEGDFTVEMVVHGLAEDARLLDMGEVFSLTVEASTWVVRSGMRRYVLGKVAAQPSMHVVVGVERDRLVLYVNGEHLDALALEPSILASDADALYWGGHPEKGFLGPDRLSHLALYDRVMDSHAVARHAAYFRNVWASQVLSTPEVVRARVVVPSGIPSPADIAPYRRALVINEYEITMGERAGDRLLAAHWAILDGKILAHAARPLGSEHDLKLVMFDERPELEGERVSMDHENLLLDWHYDLSL